MRIFISHSIKNEKIVLKFAEFLESINSEIEVFCSSEKGSIGTGKNFVKTIFDELDACDLFIPVLSREYYESKFCMIELGVAYSYLIKKYKSNGEDYIFPYALYPVTKSQALAGTPMMNIQVGEINDKEDIRSLLEYIDLERKIHIGAGANRKLHALITEIDQILLKNQNIIEMANIGTYFDDKIDFRCKEDIVKYSIKDNAIVVNYNMNPYEKENVKYPNFISMVLGFPDKIDLGRYLDFNDEAEFNFLLTSFTHSLTRIFVEFKHSDGIRPLGTMEFQINYGENKIHIPLKKMQSKALGQIAEICFVIHPADVLEKEGMFQISEITIS